MTSAAVCVLAMAGCVSALGGPLAPPAGPVAPTYKTLTEVEPRTAVNSTNTPGDAGSVFRITAPGSYYLTGNVTGVSGKNGIQVAASDVTLDLNGFEVLGVAGSLTGVTVGSGGFVNTAVVNGSVRGWGVSGVDLVGGFGFNNTRIENVSASSCLRYGLRTGLGGILSHCQATNIGPDPTPGVTSYGLIVFSNGGVIVDCRASKCTGYGIVGGTEALIHHCEVFSCGKDGISVLWGSSVSDCVSSSNTQYGISTNQDGSNGTGIRIADCVAYNNTAAGIQASGSSTIINNTSTSNGAGASGVGILVQGSGCRVDGNYAANNRVGISVSASGNSITRNAATQNAGGNYAIVAGNDVGPIGTAATSTSPWANLQW